MSTCWFCNKRESEPQSKLVVNLHKELSRTQKKVTYQTSSLTIDRCPTCKAAMQKSKLLGILFFALSVITIFMSCVVIQMATDYNFSDGTVTLLLVLIGVLVLAFAFIGIFLASKPFTKAEIRKEVSYMAPIKAHPRVDSLIKQGWKIGKKPTS